MIIEKEMKMKNGLFRLWVVIIFGTLWVVLSGCASSPSRFYLLSSLDTTSPEMKPPAEERCLSIGIGPIKIPEYIDRQQIVIQRAPNEFTLAEFDRWGEPIKDNLTRVLAKNISLLVCTKTVTFFPWRGGLPIDYRIEMEVLRLDGSPGGTVALEAWWMVLSGDGKSMLLAKRSSFTEAVGGKDFKALVAAESRTVGRLSAEIAEAIRTLRK